MFNTDPNPLESPSTPLEENPQILPTIHMDSENKADTHLFENKKDPFFEQEENLSMWSYTPPTIDFVETPEEEVLEIPQTAVETRPISEPPKSSNPFLASTSVEYAPISSAPKENSSSSPVNNEPVMDFSSAPPVGTPQYNPSLTSDVIAGPTSFPYGGNTPPTPYGPIPEEMAKTAPPMTPSTYYAPPSFGAPVTPSYGYTQQPITQLQPSIGSPVPYGYPQHQQIMPPAPNPYGAPQPNYNYPQQPMAPQQFPIGAPAPYGYPQQSAGYYTTPPVGYGYTHQYTIPQKKEGKSKAIASVLCLLGCIGAQRFYLGYIKRGILSIFLTIIGFLLTWVPTWMDMFKNGYKGYGVTDVVTDITPYNIFYYIGVLILVIVYVFAAIDFVRILKGKLKSKDGKDLH